MSKSWDVYVLRFYFFFSPLGLLWFDVCFVFVALVVCVLMLASKLLTTNIGGWVEVQRATRSTGISVLLRSLGHVLLHYASPRTNSLSASQTLSPSGSSEQRLNVCSLTFTCCQPLG